MRLPSTAHWWRWHRWLGWVVGLQVALWVIGGALFAWLPFQAWVKSGDAVAKPASTLRADWQVALARARLPDAPVLGVASVTTAGGPAWQIRLQGRPDLWLDSAGNESSAPGEADVRRFALSLYRGTGRLTHLESADQVTPRWAVVREVAPNRAVWVAHFDDPLGTRIYVDRATGQFVAARNNAWTLYDLFWRLHIMDYTGGEDFNNGLLRSAVAAALLLVATGAALLVLSVQRARRRRAAGGRHPKALP